MKSENSYDFMWLYSFILEFGDTIEYCYEVGDNEYIVKTHPIDKHYKQSIFTLTPSGITETVLSK